SASVDYDPKEAAQIFIEEHNHATWYFDSADFLKRAKETYAVCLVSDADRDMVEGLIQDLPIDTLVISEEVGSYKHNSNGKMFTTVIEHFGCRAQDILHIGDSSSDIEGAGQLNIDTCWLNRRKVSKHFSISPTYEVASLCD
ncbi:putative multi-domain containing protein, partial [Aduncisulcus paluster]